MNSTPKRGRPPKVLVCRSACDPRVSAQLEQPSKDAAPATLQAHIVEGGQRHHEAGTVRYYKGAFIDVLKVLELSIGN